MINMICPNCKIESTNWKVYPPQCNVCKYEFKDHADGIELEDRGD
jgi:predicted Zn-ribbon and HTH transcriptional regulator